MNWRAVEAAGSVPGDGGYPTQHAARYPKLAHTISRHPEPLREIYESGRLRNLPGIGETVAQIIAEFQETAPALNGRSGSNIRRRAC
jgi:hypothetical protein